MLNACVTLRTWYSLQLHITQNKHACSKRYRTSSKTVARNHAVRRSSRIHTDCVLTEQLKNSSSVSAFEHCSVSNGQSGGLDDDCGLQKAHHAAPQLFLQCCSVGPLLRSCFSEERSDRTTCLEDGGPIWHGQPSQCASPSRHMQMEQTARVQFKDERGWSFAAVQG